MHILLLSNEYPPFIIGGIGTFTKTLAQGLSRMGAKVTVLSGYPVVNFVRARCTQGASSFQENSDGVTVLRFPYPDIPPRHTMFQLSNLSQLCKTIQEIGPDVIHGQSGSTFPVSSILKDMAPFVVTFHTSPKIEKLLSTYSLLRGGSWRDFFTYVIGYPAWSFTFRKELRCCKSAVAVSKALKLDLLNEMGKTCDEKIRYVSNGVDVETLDKEYRISEGLEESNDTILFASRLFWRKGALEIIKIAHILQRKRSDCKIIVHGEGPLLSSMERKINELRLSNIEIKGFTSRSQLIKSMRVSKFVAIPSLYEACPMILLESMCLGKIPLMFNLPYASEFTQNGLYGIISNNSNDMVTKFIQLTREADLESFSNKIRAFARHEFSVGKTALSYYRLYKEVIN